ncbi:hypothetical protein GCM10010168_05630 [Actinoplanes ianthinogenes]|uniref:Uncharacterized protein n=1 Tax=Actinoplanes ianthinogenes TaxID=122358 RepID=A0ABM7LTX0_9ACTN|nr:hypothetical protein [Actinoplanes ianthinogenes]BCJ42695.1 hypothetical protein Aiant_33520 [Actinoplanes ianthinogenes]GGQ92841.1 hypothetical protein GCM10010168_05630 [Actinoplanes ianthinogenes]
MTTLESRYRTLLRVYPAAHRAAYEEEMLGVLLAGSPPDRRFPSLGDALDLLRAGLTARFARSGPASRTGWHDAAAVAGVLVALLLGGFALATFAEATIDLTHGSPRQLAGVDGLIDPALRAVAWLAVAAVAVAGRYRAAAVLSAAALLVELGTLTFWLGLTPWQSMRLAWTPIVAILVTAAFVTARTARPVRSVVGGFGLALLAVAALTPAFAAWAAETPVFEWDDLAVWLPLALFAGVVIGIDPPVRRRVALLFPAMLLAPIALLETWDATVLAGYSGSRIPEMITARETLLSLAPVAIVAAVALAVILTRTGDEQPSGFPGAGGGQEGVYE